MTAVALPAQRHIPHSRAIVVGIGLVVVALLALALDIPVLGSFVYWLLNVVPGLSYLIVQYAVPIAFAALCGVMCERSGVTNIGIEGMILTAAFVGFLAGAYLVLGTPWSAIVAIGFACLAAMLLSTLHAWLSITVKSDQIISGTVINILA